MDTITTIAFYVGTFSIIGLFAILAFLFWIAWTQKPYDGGGIRIGETHEPKEQTPARSHYPVTRPAARLNSTTQAALPEPKTRALPAPTKK